MKKGILLLLAITMIAGSCSRQAMKQKNETDGQTVASIADRYIKAIGGRSAIDSVKSVQFNAIGELAGVVVNLKIGKTINGEKFIDATMDNINPQRTVWNGKTGYVLTKDGKTELSPSTRVELLRNKLLFPETEFAKDKYLKLVGKEMVWDEPAYKIVGKGITYFYDVKTGLKVEELTTQIQDGKTVQNPTIFSNYQTVQGIKLPFSFEEKINGTKTRFKILEYKINTAQPADFQ